MSEQPRFILLSIGDELLSGKTINTNAGWIGRRLAESGCRLLRVETVADDPGDIERALRRAIDEVDYVMTTGGLGPTEDDRTRDVIATMLGTPLVLDEEQRRRIVERFAAVGREPNERSLDQALVPEGVDVLHNDEGTAPGFAARIDGSEVFVLPGVPAEMTAMVDRILATRIEQTSTGAARYRLLTGIPESVLAERLESIERDAAPEILFGYLPSHGVIRLRLIASPATPSDRLDAVVASVDEVTERYLLAPTPETLDEFLARRLVETDRTLSIAESCTGGRILDRLTAIPGASRFLRGGVVAYANEVKIAALGVDSATLEEFGAVSRQTAEQMVRGVAELTGSDFAVATTGIAGPSGGTPQKPVGTVFTAYLTPEDRKSVV